MQRFALSSVLLLLLATACAGDGQQISDEQDGEGAAAVELGTADGSAPAPAGAPSPTDGSPGRAPAGDAAGSDAVPGEIETVQAGEAGEVDVRRTADGRLELVAVRAAAGWTHTLDDTDDNEVEVDFRHDNGRALALDIELEDGQLRVDTD